MSVSSLSSSLKKLMSHVVDEYKCAKASKHYPGVTSKGINGLIIWLDQGLATLSKSSNETAVAFAEDNKESINLLKHDPFVVTRKENYGNGPVPIYAFTTLVYKSDYVLAMLWLDENNYIQPLKRKYRQLIFVDDYDDLNTSQWESEKARFIRSRELDFMNFKHRQFPAHLQSMLEEYESGYNYYQERLFESLSFVIDDIAATEELSSADEESETPFEKLDTDDPYEYERLVSELLEAFDWDSKVTRGSGDQGADVLATTPDGIRVVIQCKLYSKPVGNKAVQEAISARMFYECDEAAVITNQSFTKSARQLAGSSGVYLLHHEQVSELVCAIESQKPI